jgi:hypothetical protein
VRKYVVCIDTMGQDRPLNVEEIERALQTIQKYSDCWSQLEKRNLKSDILRREVM